MDTRGAMEGGRTGRPSGSSKSDEGPLGVGVGVEAKSIEDERDGNMVRTDVYAEGAVTAVTSLATFTGFHSSA